MRRGGRNSLLLYLILNIIVSAATVLAVLMVWERLRPQETPALPTAPADPIPASEVVETPLPTLTPTLPGPAGELIEIAAVIGATDPQQEYVQLRRLGEGDLSLAGWQLKDEDGNVYTFSKDPELILYKGGAVLVYTRVGNDTPTEVFWNRTEAVWRPGEWATLVDNLGQVQARFQVP
ncbi:MAG TPA: hypothetical protein DEQ80_08075 [Anaerolinea thermolimosa]|uniref:Protein containing lamin tail domain n=1 Tax=Anaerolinea thermolimosa TaxID=229919 RepID=A0A3D1JGU7_9CHLR|nr:lamin tail domain-containing protein [Anaerolinea thermolimosa]GAP08528.1 protein containing lamin tail domain [Anaerolinea thermolimosa]HCE17801.1 hypothetical protein [Anaerolinea thermolimosa]